MIIALLLVFLIPIPAIAQDINSELIEAAKNGDTVSIKALLEAGADVNTTDVNDRTALIWAAQKGHTETPIALSEQRLTQPVEMLNFLMSQDLMFCDIRLGLALEWLE